MKQRIFVESRTNLVAMGFFTEGRNVLAGQSEAPLFTMLDFPPLDGNRVSTGHDLSEECVCVKVFHDGVFYVMCELEHVSKVYILL